MEEVRINLVAFIERGFYWLTIRQFEYQLNNDNYGLQAIGSNTNLYLYKQVKCIENLMRNWISTLSQTTVLQILISGNGRKNDLPVGQLGRHCFSRATFIHLSGTSGRLTVEIKIAAVRRVCGVSVKNA